MVVAVLAETEVYLLHCIVLLIKLIQTESMELRSLKRSLRPSVTSLEKPVSQKIPHPKGKTCLHQ